LIPFFPLLLDALNELSSIILFSFIGAAIVIFLIWFLHTEFDQAMLARFYSLRQEAFALDKMLLV